MSYYIIIYLSILKGAISSNQFSYVLNFNRTHGQFLLQMPCWLFVTLSGAHSRAEKRKWLRHCPAASKMVSSALSFKMIGDTVGILREKNT